MFVIYVMKLLQNINKQKKKSINNEMNKLIRTERSSLLLSVVFRCIIIYFSSFFALAVCLARMFGMLVPHRIVIKVNGKWDSAEYNAIMQHAEHTRSSNRRMDADL